MAPGSKYLKNTYPTNSSNQKKGQAISQVIPKRPQKNLKAKLHNW